ncbi:MAG: cellulase family glycosylhydrolase [Anaerolineaceae bacterium]|nr:cellulase family glycosylhydrolase [Anaerolineaceae bacterium]
MRRSLIIVLLLILAACTPRETIYIVVTPTPQPLEVTPVSTIGAIIDATSESMPRADATQPTLTPIPTRPGEAGEGGPIIDAQYTLPPSSTPRPTATPIPTTPAPTESVTETTPVDTPASVSINNLPFEVPYLDGREMGIQLDWNVTEDEWYQLIQRILPLNITWVKIQIDWSFVVPEPSSEPSVRFRALEQYVERLRQNNFKVLLSVAKAPSWLRPDGAEEDGPPTDPQAYADFLSLMLQEFGDSVHAIEIWNEPNLAREWRGGLEFSGAGYMQLFVPAYNAIRAYSPDIAIITAGLAPTGIVPGETIPDRDYLRQMYAAGLGSYDDIYIGAHPFGWSNSADATCCSSSSQGFDDNESFFFLENIDDLYSIMQENGDSDLQLWVTEFGWATWDGLPQPAPFVWMDNNTILEQAEYTVRAFQIGQQRPEVGPMILWNLNFANNTLIDNRNEIAGYSLFVPGQPIRPLYEILASRPQ